ncbi:MAG: AAA family ATPase [Bacilli bacterium]|nr:AAA family ATPase [Bacilli bacterium]
MLVLIGPSASGKTEIANILISKYGMKRLITYTTREKRCNEINGRDYHFISVEEFKKFERDAEFVETTFYNGNYYGSKKKDVSLEKVVILDPNGLCNYAKTMRKKITSVFLETPKEVRAERMLGRNDKPELIKIRLEKDDEIFQKDKLPLDFVVENNGIDLITLADKVYQLYQNHQENVFL